MTTTNTRHSIPTPLGPFLSRVCAGCHGRVPLRSVPAGLALALWAIDGVSEADRAAYEASAVHWALSAAFTLVGDVTRSIAMRPELYPRGDA